MAAKPRSDGNTLLLDMYQTLGSVASKVDALLEGHGEIKDEVKKIAVRTAELEIINAKEAGAKGVGKSLGTIFTGLAGGSMGAFLTYLFHK